MSQTVIECNCKICKVNAEKIGQSLPLRASVPTKMLSGAKTAKGRHTLIREAHNPGALGEAMRRAYGIKAV